MDYIHWAALPQGLTNTPRNRMLHTSWWRHHMETFSALLSLCAGNSTVTGEFPIQRPVTRSFDIFFDLRLNKRLSKQSWGWWFDTPSCSLWRHCNVVLLWNCTALPKRLIDFLTIKPLYRCEITFQFTECICNGHYCFHLCFLCGGYVERRSPLFNIRVVFDVTFGIAHVWHLIQSSI